MDRVIQHLSVRDTASWLWPSATSVESVLCGEECWRNTCRVRTRVIHHLCVRDTDRQWPHGQTNILHLSPLLSAEFWPEIWVKSQRRKSGGGLIWCNLKGHLIYVARRQWKRIQQLHVLTFNSLGSTQYWVAPNAMLQKCIVPDSWKCHTKLIDDTWASIWGKFTSRTLPVQVNMVC